VPVGATGTKALDRINEIKHIVNEKIGNPINLIDKDNAVGREYMNALLEAMKKSNGGQAAEVMAAMDRLESVFAKVLLIIEEPAAVVPPPPVEEVPHSETVVSPSSPKEVLPETEPATNTSPTTIEHATAASPRDVVTPSANIASDVPDTPQPSVTPVVPPAPTAVPSVAKAKQVEELMHKQHIDAMRESEVALRVQEEKMDPLMVSAVTAGLNQLLSEWGLFKSSGLFGTGPSGSDHPLYKKIASLPMQAVIAGRFEGATPQIRQSIADYMNGWRYEEGIVFDYGESFEHYLRRVIRHILDKRSAPKQ
jgi:hypothetical protein